MTGEYNADVPDRCPAEAVMTGSGLAANEKYSGYISLVDSTLLQHCGVTYSQLIAMAPAMDPDSRFIQTAAARDLHAMIFAQFFQGTHQLSVVTATSRDYAENFNLRRAAIAAFAVLPAEARNGADPAAWVLGADGRAYGTGPSGRLTRLEVANKDENWGFAVSISGETAPLGLASRDPLHRLAAPDERIPFTRLASALDIGEAVTRAAEKILDMASEEDMIPVM
jgi:hypothetical protein